MWDITIILDEATTGVGTISGTWTDEDGKFTYTDRSTVDAAGQEEFLKKANIAKDAWKAKAAAEKAIAAALTAAANEGGS